MGFVLRRFARFYRQFANTEDLGVGSAVGNIKVHGDTRMGLAARLPLEKYFAATLAERDALTTGGKTTEAVARERGLSVKYLSTLWSSLSGSAPSLLLDDLSRRKRRIPPRALADPYADLIAGKLEVPVNYGPLIVKLTESEPDCAALS